MFNGFLSPVGFPNDSAPPNDTTSAARHLKIFKYATNESHENLPNHPWSVASEWDPKGELMSKPGLFFEFAPFSGRRLP